MNRIILDAPDIEPIDLVDLDTVRDELGVSDSSGDERLGRWITQVSGAINAYVGRVLRAQNVVETFVQGDAGYGRNDVIWSHRGAAGGGALKLSRYPVVAITSVVVGDETLASDGTAYELDARAGLLYRAHDTACYRAWGGGRVVVTYRAGWAMDEVPGAVREAALQMISYRKGARGRDPSLRSISIPGVADKSYHAAPAPAGGSGGLPADVATMLDYLRDTSA